MEVLSSATSPFKKRRIDSSYADDVALVAVGSPERLLENSTSTDLKADSYGVEISKVIDSKLSEERKKIEELLKSPKKKRPQPVRLDWKIMKEKMVPTEELEEFFSAAEKLDQNRFLQKYNFDIVKDLPVEGGQYEWIRLK